MPRLLFRQSLPAIIGLLVMSLYNVVDAIFIGQSVGALGIAGLAICFPVQMMIIAIAQTIGIGAASIISRAMGAKQQARAEEALGNFFTLTLILGTVFTILGLVFITPILQLFGATDSILLYAKEYLQIILYGTFFLCFTASSNNIIRAEGSAKFAMKVMIASALVNIVLDPILIFGFDMGLSGAAIATVTSQVIASLVAFYYFASGRNSVRVHFANFKLKLKLTKEIFAIGSSALARQSAGSVEQAVLNHSLGFYGGDLAIAAFGIINRMMMTIFMPMFGLVQGMQPVLGFNHGARETKRASDAVTLTMKAATIFSIAAFAGIMLFSESLIRIFTSDSELIKLTDHAVRIVILMLPLIGFQVIAGGVYQALGKPWQALVLSTLRQLLFLVPLVLLLSYWIGLDGVFWAFPTADVLASVVTGTMIYRELKKWKNSKLVPA